MSKLFTVAGYSTSNNKIKFRVANNMNRVAVLKRCGDTNIELLTLPTAMTKETALKYMTHINNGAAILTAAGHLGLDRPAVKAPIKTRRVPSELPKGADAEKYASAWFKQAEQRVAAQ